MYKALLVALTFSFTTLFTLSAQTPAPFNTAVRNYVYVGKTGYNANVTRITLHKSTDPAASNGAFDTGQAINFINGTAQGLNGAGINRQDGFLYAIEYLYSGPFSTSAKFFRVGANAVATQIGVIPAPTANDAGRSVTFSFVNLACGTVDSAGNYWFTGYTYTDMDTPASGSKVDMFLGKISNINSLTPSTTASRTPTYQLDISDTILQRGYTNLMTQQLAMIAWALPPTNADGGWQDMDINPSNHQFYSYIGFPGTASSIGSNPYPKPGINSYLIRIDQSVTPWKVVPVNTTPNTFPNREQDGAYFDGAGNFYVGFTDGNYSPVNLTTGALSGVNQSSLPLYQNNLRGDFATNAPLAPIALPVLLAYFGATPTGEGNIVRWGTTSENNVVRFELLRSDDGRDFSPVVAMPPRGDKSTYSFMDVDAVGTVYYRLNIIAIDGLPQLSQTVEVRGKEPGRASFVYPTTIDNGSIQVSAATQQVIVRIYDLNGNLVHSSEHKSTGIPNHFSILLSAPAGTYMVYIIDSKSGRRLVSEPVIKS